MDNYAQNLKAVKDDLKELEKHIKMAESAKLLSDISKEEKAIVNITEGLGRDTQALRISSLLHLRGLRHNG